MDLIQGGLLVMAVMSCGLGCVLRIYSLHPLFSSWRVPLDGYFLRAAQIKHAEHVVPEAAALTSVKPRETNALRIRKSEYGTEGIKEPALRHICALCVWICVEKMNLCVPSLRYWGFFRICSKSSVTGSTQQQQQESGSL